MSGTFYVAVAGVNSAGEGPLSTPVPFTIPCAVPLIPSSLTVSLGASTATATWNAARGASTYVVQVGTAPGASNLFSGNVGNRTTVSATAIPAGFRAYVRVIAVNACGASLPTPDVLIQ
jgi:hypothetical protein